MSSSHTSEVFLTEEPQAPVFPGIGPLEPMSKKEYKRAETRLRRELLEVQSALREADFPVHILLCGVDGAGKGGLSNLLNEWMDPRGITTRAYDVPSQAELERPDYWRFWRDLPARGSIGIFLSAWYHRPLVDKAHDEIGEGRFEEDLGRIRAFERTLADDGALLIKIWMHLDREQQRTRFEALEADPLQEWRVTNRDWKHWRMYDRFVAASEAILRATAREGAPWLVTDGSDERRRCIAIGDHIGARLREHLEVRQALARARAKATPEPAPEGEPGSSTVLAQLDLGQSLQAPDYRRQLVGHQATLNRLYRRARERGISTVLVFEGWDAAGKGGAIRRLIPALDARGYRVISIAAPTDEELAHHYLWRFWRNISGAGRVTIFDRSWYGRVLVERVEGFAQPDEWGRAYEEINDFEADLTRHGIVVLKFWFHVSREEQEKRFEARARTPHKRWKLTDEDWRNREKWGAYELAVDDMVRRTDTKDAPWILVAGNDKPFARVKVLEQVCERLARALD